MVAQDHVTRTLRNAVASGKVVHAYLFCGPRGTGKTSTARILAKAVNCLDPQGGEPCNRCPSCTSVNEGRAIDLIEIDAASNRGIDDARELREKIRFAPAEARYKVYIIDEAHMLTSEASNALLKTLEEPPGHAILILATTEAHKILPTIASRCQRFDFRRIPLQAIAQQLSMICEREGLRVEPAVLDRVARMARGSLRDAESLLDQLVAYCGDQIGLDEAREVLGLTTEESIHQLAEALRLRDLPRGFQLIDDAASTGADLRHLTRELVDHLRALMVAKSGADTSLLREYRADDLAKLREDADGWEYHRLLGALRSFGELDGRMRQEPLNQIHLEVAFMEAALLEQAGAVGGAGPEHAASGQAAPARDHILQMQRSGVSEPGGQAGAPTSVDLSAPGRVTGVKKAASEEVTSEAGGVADEGSVAHRPAGGSADLTMETLRRQWPSIVQKVGTSAALVLAGCRPVETSGDKVVLGFEKSTWRDKVERLGVRGRLEEILKELFGRPITVQFAYGVKLNRGVPPDQDVVVDAAVRELGFRLARVERTSDQ